MSNEQRDIITCNNTCAVSQLKQEMLFQSICWTILAYGSHVFPRNYPLCTYSVRPLSHASVFCRGTLHSCTNFPLGLLGSLLSVLSQVFFSFVSLGTKPPPQFNRNFSSDDISCRVKLCTFVFSVSFSIHVLFQSPYFV